MSSFADISGGSRVHFSGLAGGIDNDLRSLSSVDPTEARRGDSGLGLYDETMPLYQRLQELDQLTSSFLQVRPLALTDAYDTFSDIDANRQQLFELRVPLLKENDVLCVAVIRVPRAASGSPLSLYRKKSKTTYENTLDICLKYSRDAGTVSGCNMASGFDSDAEEGLAFTPTFFQDTYDLVVTPAHGLIPGKYILNVTNRSADELVSVRIQHGITQQVAATPIQIGTVLRGSTAANEFKFYRYVCHDPSKLITIRVRPVMSSPTSSEGKGTPIGDPDLYVTNRYSGFVALSKDNAIWKSTTVGVDRVDILPDDAEAQRGSIYIIGVLGCKKVNDFELSVTTCVPEPIHEFPIATDVPSSELQLQRGQYKYFKIPIDSSSKGKIVLKIEPGGHFSGLSDDASDVSPYFSAVLEADHRMGNTSAAYKRNSSARNVTTSRVEGPSGRQRDDIRATAVLQRFGRGVYSHDWFAEYGLFDAYFRGKHPELKAGASEFSSFHLAFGRSSFAKNSGSSIRGTALVEGGSGMTKVSSVNSFVSNTSLSAPGSPNRSACVDNSDGQINYSNQNVFNSPTAAGYIVNHHQSSQSGHLAGSPLSGTHPDATSILSEALNIEKSALTHIFPPSICRDDAGGIYPVAFLSSTCMYPSEEHYTWRASAADGSLIIVLDMDEWKHSSDVCYMSVLGLSIPEASHLALQSNGVSSIVLSSQTPVRLEPGAPPSEISIKLSSWMRQETSEMSERDRKAYKIFRKIYDEINGAAASQQDRATDPDFYLSGEVGSNAGARKKVHEDDLAFTYGEVEFPSFLQILNTAKATDGQIFVDLGCGAGKAIVAAALSDIRFLRVTGVELLPTLVSCCRKAISALREAVQKHQNSADISVNFEQRLAGASDSVRNILPLIDIKEGDILDIDWTDADLVYISSICFPESVLQKIFERATKLKIGSTLITLKLIPGFEKYFELRAERWFKMSWGSILVYFLSRVPIY